MHYTLWNELHARKRAKKLFQAILELPVVTFILLALIPLYYCHEPTPIISFFKAHTFVLEHIILR